MTFGITDLLVLLGSLGLFLYGMKVMSDALVEVAGDKMRSILASMTSSRIFAVGTGFLITSVIQSSSATTLMVVSFVNASLLTLSESVGVIMGANIGTTVTAWLITILGFKVSMSAISLPLVAFGFLLTFSKKSSTRHWGRFVIGFSILFIGLQFLKDSVPDIKEHPEILEWLSEYTGLGFWSVLIFLLIGTLLTVILQSSSATMALTLIMCHEGWIPFDMAAAMVLGENIGTTITANLAALVANYNAKRTARAHFIFNILGVIWMLLLYYPFLNGINHFLVTNGGASPFENSLAIPVALSTFHTAFNIINTGILIFFIPLIVRIVERIIPATEEPEPSMDVPKFLNDDALRYPQTAISALMKESRRLYEGPTFKVVAHALNLHRTDILSDLKPKKVVKASTEAIDIDIDDIYYSRVKGIYSRIMEYAVTMQSKFSLSKKKVEEISLIKIANRHSVEVIKESRHVTENFDRFIVSDNKFIKAEYNVLRKKVIQVIRTIIAVRNSKNPGSYQKKLVKLQRQVKNLDVLISGRLNELVSDRSITPEMASSLANDSAIVASICKNLLSAAELLFIESDSILTGLSAVVELEEA